jgi:quercetin dioxygenase-like cupin family protein
MIITPIMKAIEEQIKFIQIGCIHLTEDGVIGRHEASVPQLFIVVSGEGWVTGQENVKRKIKAGELVIWEAGEWHEVKTQKGLMAIVIESDKINPMKNYLNEILI